jgi:hypothetical protein
MEETTMNLFQRVFSKKKSLTRKDVIAIIDAFLKGTYVFGPHEWDYFISVSIDEDSHLEGVRLRCGDLRRDYPPDPGESAYCNQHGTQVLRELLSELQRENGVLEKNESTPG